MLVEQLWCFSPQNWNKGFLKHNAAVAETIFPKPTEYSTEGTEVLISSGTVIDHLFLLESWSKLL